MGTKQTIRFIESQIEKVSRRVQRIVSEEQKLVAQKAPLLEDLKAYQRIRESLTGKSRSREPIPVNRVGEIKRRGRKSKKEIVDFFRFQLKDRQEHRLQDMIGGIQRLHGITIPRSTARDRLSKMPDVEKAPRRLIYRLKEG